MSFSSHDSPGLVGNAAAGYRLAWIHRRQLLSVVLPVLAPAWLGLVLLDLLLGRDHLVIIDGVAVVRDGDGTVLAWARLVLVAAFWLLALSAGALAATGAARGHAVRPRTAILAAVRHFPVFAAGMCAVGGGTFLLLWVVGGLAGAAGGPVGLALLLGVLAASAVVAARMLVGLVSHQLGGSDWRLTRGRVPSTAGAFLLGGVALPLAVAGLLFAVSVPATSRAIGALLLTGVVAVQSGILAHVYLMPREQTPPGETAPPARSGLARESARPGGVEESARGAGVGEAAQPGGAAESAGSGGAGEPGQSGAGKRVRPRSTVPASGVESADLAGVDALLAEMSGGRTPGRPWAAVAAMVIALLAPAGVAAADPFGAPTVRSHSDVPGEVAALAWPAGQHPVMATLTGARFCDDDLCDRYVAPVGAPGVMGGNGSAGISADGSTVVKAIVTGSQESGGPFLHFGRCTRAGCRQAWLPVRASAKEAFGWPELAVAVAPDQAVWFVLAMPSPDDQPGEANYRVTFVRCADAGCAKPQRHPAGTVWRMRDDRSSSRPRARLSIGADGRPVAAIRTGTAVIQVTCDPVTCAAPRDTSSLIDQSSAAWTTMADRSISFRPGQLQIGERLVPLDGGEIAPWSGAVAVAGSGVLAAAAEATDPPGLHVWIGEPAEHGEYWQQVLWRCDQARCRRQVLDAFEAPAAFQMMTASADGRVLIVRQDRMLLVSG